MSIPFTFLSVLFLINAFNYFDGVDGTLCFTSISVLGILYFLSIEHHQHFLISDQNSQYFLVIIIIPILIFLLFNFSLFNLPKMFLGDSGSLLLGFVISFILIYFANQKLIEPIILAWSIAIFVYEFLSINIIRLINKQKLFKAGQDHMHHLLLRKFNSILITNTFIFLLNIALFLVGYFSNLLFNQLISLILFIIFFYIFCFKKKIFKKIYIIFRKFYSYFFNFLFFCAQYKLSTIFELELKVFNNLINNFFTSFALFFSIRFFNVFK